MFKINIHKKYIFSLFVVMKTNFYSGKSTLKWMIRIEKGTFLYQKQKTSDQNTTKLSFSFLPLTSYLKSSFPSLHFAKVSHFGKVYIKLLSLTSYLKSSLPLFPFIILTSYLKSSLPLLPLFPFINH